jgi:hypothetical protein
MCRVKAAKPIVERKTRGTIAVEKHRPVMNKLTDAARRRLHQRPKPRMPRMARMGWRDEYEPSLYGLPIRVIGGTHERCATPVTPLQLLILKGL